MSPFYQRYLGFFKLGLLLEDDITEGSYPFFTNLFSVHLINNFFCHSNVETHAELWVNPAQKMMLD